MMSGLQKVNTNRKQVSTPLYTEIDIAATYFLAIFYITAKDGNQLLYDKVIAAYSKNIM